MASIKLYLQSNQLSVGVLLTYNSLMNRKSDKHSTDYLRSYILYNEPRHRMLTMYFLGPFGLGLRDSEQAASWLVILK